MEVCKSCGKQFTPRNIEQFNTDFLCGVCRSNLKVNRDKRRRTNTCPVCGKKILRTSKMCSSCSQTGEGNHQYKEGSFIKDRFCKDCGKPLSIGSQKGQCQSCYIKTLKGEGNPNYRFGHYTANFRATSAYKTWKIAVFERDGFTCQLCGEKKSRDITHAHHIKPKRLYPELVYEINNGITLCKECHEFIGKDEQDYEELFYSIVNNNNH